MSSSKSWDGPTANPKLASHCPRHQHYLHPQDPSRRQPIQRVTARFTPATEQRDVARAHEARALPSWADGQVAKAHPGGCRPRRQDIQGWASFKRLATTAAQLLPTKGGHQPTLPISGHSPLSSRAHNAPITPHPHGTCRRILPADPLPFPHHQSIHNKKSQDISAVVEAKSPEGDVQSPPPPRGCWPATGHPDVKSPPPPEEIVI